MIDKNVYGNFGVPLLFDIIEEGLSDDPELFEGWTTARKAFMDGDFSTAERICLGLLQDDDDVALWYTLFLVYWFQHNENDVHRAYNRALEADIESSLSTLLTADAMFWSSTPSHAVPIYRRIIEKHPDVLYAYWMLGILLTELGHYRAAIPVMQEFLRRKPDAPYIWEPYSTAMLEAGWVEQLRTELNTATKNQPRNYMVWRSLGEVLLLQQDWEAGMKVFHRLMEVMPEDPFTRNGLASCLKGTDRVEASLKHYRKVAECEGTEFEGWMNLAFALQELGKEDEAQEAYDKAEAAAPGKFQFTMQQIQHQIDEVKARMV
ncbi:MAG: tetratricopeptide repeat protein [Promethearchaeia archaeon]